MSDLQQISPEEALQEAIKKGGGAGDVGGWFGISHQAVYAWSIAPPTRVLELEKRTGVSRHLLRPDIYGPLEQHEAV